MVLFISEKLKSPTIDSTASHTPMMIRGIKLTVNCGVIRLPNKKPIATAASTQVKTPPIAPSTVFLGLILGQSLCFPNSEPAKKAPASAIHGTAKQITKKKLRLSDLIQRNAMLEVPSVMSAVPVKA